MDGMTDPTDEELMDRFCQGDNAAFGALFERLSPSLFGFLSPMVRDAALAEDLLQTTFLSVLRSRDRYVPGSRVRPWVFTIAANAARDVLRRKGLKIEQLSATGELDADAGSEDVERDPALRKHLERALAQLPEEQRTAVLLHKMHGWSFEQIGEVLGTTPLAARLKAHRGYERLRALLAHLEAS